VDEYQDLNACDLEVIERPRAARRFDTSGWR
jgi:hypothetical protein